MTSAAQSPLDHWEMEREVVLTRLIKARRETVFAAWTDPKHLPVWFGPAGFTIETKEIDVRVGGRWRFDMIAPDGAVYPNRMVFRRIEAPHLLEVDHGSDVDDDPIMFRMTVTFDEQSDGKTALTLRQLHPSRARRQEVIGFGAVEYGLQTLDKLARHVEAAA